jgi:uncharacterized protein (DUF736 family)
MIGTLTKKDSGFEGAVATLTLKAKIAILPIEKASDQAPDFRVYAGNAEIGAAWSAKSKAGKDYLSIKLDDPSFAAPLQCRAVENETGYALVWSR